MDLDDINRILDRLKQASINASNNMLDYIYIDYSYQRLPSYPLDLLTPLDSSGSLIDTTNEESLRGIYGFDPNDLARSRDILAASDTMISITRSYSVETNVDYADYADDAALIFSQAFDEACTRLVTGREPEDEVDWLHEGF